jgi:long-chain fatty acid transport protein
MNVSRFSRWLLTGAALAAPTILSAQGFGLNEIGACPIARAFATTASPCRDASTIFWNPAGGTMIDGWNVVAGVASIALNDDFRQDTTGLRFDGNARTQYVPHVFANYHKAGSSLGYGLGVYVPYGLTSQWPDNFPGRFYAQKATLQTIYVQPNIAWQIDSTWSIGGGPIYAHSSIELDQAIDLSTQTTPTGATFGQLGIAQFTQFASARLKGSASGFGAQIGVRGRIDNSWSVGLRLLSPIRFNYDNADATFTQVATGLRLGANLPVTPTVTIPQGTPIDALVAPQFLPDSALSAGNVSTKITHPAQIQAGVAYTGFKSWLLEADYAWINWKSFDKLPITFSNPRTRSTTLIENYNNSSAFRLGAEYSLPNDGWKLRAGFAGASSAAPPETVTPLLPEQDRYYFNFGVGIPLGKKLTVDGTYSYVGTNGARGRLIERLPTQTADQVNSGVFNVSANIFAVTFKANF